MPEFLGKCFVNFRVAFWGSKSKGYMDEVIPAMLGRMKCKEPVILAFVWSMAECDEIQWWNNDPVAWGCPLEIVFRKWPHWNLSNTVIIDHNSLRVNCNPHANVIVPTPFYLAQLTKLGEDGQFLKTSLWPQLTGLFGATNMEDFETHFLELRLLIPKIPKLEDHDHENINNVVHSLAGEGTCRSFGSTCEVSPYLPLNLLLIILVSCAVQTRAQASKDGGSHEESSGSGKEGSRGAEESNRSGKETAGEADSEGPKCIVVL
jgi:hypothetical protein